MSTKDELLNCLKEEKGKWVSGESLSRKMTVTRSAVWKHIGRLKEEGYVIESSRKKGYLLRQASDLLLANEIREGLETRIFGKGDIVHFLETDSTNLRAKALAQDGAPEGTVVIAESQTEGRGRRGRAWYSPAGEGVYVSLILRPALPPNEAAKLTLLSSVAVAETLNALTPLAARIKWPNDIMAGGRKLAGILTQVSTEMEAVDYMIVGIGINVNTPPESFPADLRSVAASVRGETGSSFPRITLLRLLLEQFETWYGRLAECGFQPVMERWKALSDIIGRRISVDLLNHRYSGEAVDIDQDGVLVLRDGRGALQRIISGDITLQDEHR